MYFFRELLSNNIFICGFLGWLIAQLLKTGIYTYMNKDFRAERLVGNGGMPSSHSATVCALLYATTFEYGFDSFEFAIAFFFAVVVMLDAMGVRRETGNQAKIINELVEAWKKMGNSELSEEDRLKEFVGHTPLQVLIGAILGFVIAFFMCLVRY